jgi:hypothetical protein
MLDTGFWILDPPPTLNRPIHSSHREDCLGFDRPNPTIQHLASSIEYRVGGPGGPCMIIPDDHDERQKSRSKA